jgi:hypothetical protein
MIKHYCDKCNKELEKPIRVRFRICGCQSEHINDYCEECLKAVLGEEYYNEYKVKVERNKKIKE